MEILAPAGSPEALRAAVFSGADAVYLGGPAFGARANAKNFTLEELRAAVKFCHARGVRVHVTVNTLLKDGELPAALQFVAQLCEMAVDAVLIQDMGLFSLLRLCAPALPLHASTQMSLHTPSGAAYLQELGAARVVLSRELSLQEIREISKAASIELEAFVHGALCMSVSGQCYFSAMLGGRSGNRGQCAQPCRLPFAAPEGTGHDLSLKDLSFIKEIDQLTEAGVCSAKIEGRMKRPEYVAAAVTACRRAADGEVPPQELLEHLEAVFSRSGFTSGYLTARRGRKMFGVRTKEDVTGATQGLFSTLQKLYQKERQAVPVLMELAETAGRCTLSVREGGSGHTAVARTVRGEDADHAPLPAERCKAQLKKTGGTPFFVQECTVPEQGVRLGVSQLNALRRSALDELLLKRSERKLVPFAPLAYRPAPRPERPRALPPLRVQFRTVDQVPEQPFLCESIVLPLGTPLAELKRLKQTYPRILLEQPRAFFGAEQQVKRQMEEAAGAGFSEIVCQNLGGLALARSLSLTPHGGFGLNVFNTAALEFFKAQGLSSAELSLELTEREMTRLGGALPRGAMIYGRQALMLTRNCPLANSPKGCLHCKAPGYLTDRMRKRFPVLCTGAGAARYSEVLNSVPLWLGDKRPSLSTLDFVTCRFTTESAADCGSILAALLQNSPPMGEYTRGLFARGVE